MDPIEEFQRLLNARKLSPLTIRGYLCDIHQFMAWIESNGLALDQISPIQAGEYLAFLTSDEHELRPRIWGNYSSTTVKRKVLSVRMFFDAIDMRHD